MSRVDLDRVLAIGPKNFEEAEAAQKAFCEAVASLLRATTYMAILEAEMRVREWLRWMPDVRIHYGEEIERRHRELAEQTPAQVMASAIASGFIKPETDE